MKLASYTQARLCVLIRDGSRQGYGRYGQLKAPLMFASRQIPDQRKMLKEEILGYSLFNVCALIVFPL